ncbi:Cupredoxin [Xylaria bambusicola]|uniref:Cupredoxin n=1 Tax=Xylaria bambusicola TaxID=326684 RepID=UPI002007A441|nr:Cupredoxin [Xylaria bambusicola]KAI0521447.1 Cupredoxin [Xylaria bambusicola]
MDITSFVVSARNQALLYGDYATYHKLVVKKLHTLRKKLGIVNKNRSKFTKTGPVSPDQIAENHAFLHLALLTAERTWAHAMRLKAVHSADSKGITGRTRSHIISRLDKGARTAEHLVQILSNTDITAATDVDILEATAYAAMIRGAAHFEGQKWNECMKSYATSRIIYSALEPQKGDILKDLLSETIDPSIRYAAYQNKVPRTLAIPTIARKAFPSSDEALVRRIQNVAPDLLKKGDPDVAKGAADTPNAPHTITWRSRGVKIEDASIALAIGSTELATSRLAEKLESSDIVLPKEMAAAYDEVLIASQDAADATKRAIDELKEEGVPQSDSRIQSLQITRTAVNYQMISWRIGRNRVLSGEHDGALLDSAPNTTRKSKKDASSQQAKIEPPGRKIARLKEKVVLYDATLQSIESIKELPGVAADDGLLQQLDATAKYFHALKCLSIARSHSLVDQSSNALALIKHAYDQCQQSANFLSKNATSSSDSPILNIEIRQTDVQFLHDLLKGELQRCRAIVEIDILREKAKSAYSQAKIPLIDKLREYPAGGVDLENLVDYPPRVQPVPVKPLFFDAAWNYIDYPGKPSIAPVEVEEERQTSTPEPKKKGWSLSKSTTRNRQRRTVPLCLFVIALICFCAMTLALGLGLGLGWRRYGTTRDKAPFDHSYPDIPDDLEVVQPDQLINTRELSLDNGFVVSDQPQTREYVLDITQALAAPDGFQKPMILANRQSPGPLIEANTGDTIRVRVNNHMSNVSTAIHWHGIDQKGTTMMDGVVGVSQCGIPPGQSFTYEFRVDDQRGTFWWHAHSSVQYTDGLYGPLVIHDPKELVPQPNDEKIIFLSDVYHAYGSALLSSYLNPTSKWVPFESGVEPLADNILLNGQNTYDCAVKSTTYSPPPPYEQSSSSSTSQSSCSGGHLYTTKVRTGENLRLRLINSSSFFSYWFSIDNHMLSIVELDGIEISPIDARGVYLNVGQRASVIMTANQTVGNYYIRATLPQTCFLPYAPYTSAGLASAGYAARGILSYDDISVDEMPIGTIGNVSNPYGIENNGVRGEVWEGCDDMPFDMPQPMRDIQAYEVPEENKHYIEYMFRQAQDVNRIFINKTAYAPLPDNATLWKAVEQKFVASEANSYNSWDFGLNQQVLLVPEGEKGAQIVINSRDAMEHPWHLQLVVGWGAGLFGTASTSSENNTTTTWNLKNPMRRDTVTIPAFSHIVIRFKADNPGLWALHCHVAWHMEGGMFVSIAERPEDLVKLISEMDPTTRTLSQSFCGA